eukprot:PhM_4_TR2432/c1_g1_i2/m.50672
MSNHKSSTVFVPQKPQGGTINDAKSAQPRRRRKHESCDRTNFADTYQYHDPQYYQDPSRWSAFLTSHMDLLQAKEWFRDTYSDACNHEAERHLHRRMVQSICHALDAAYAQPSIVQNKAWQESQRLLITNLIIQAERYQGASDLELAALNQAFDEKPQAPYIRDAFTRAAERLTTAGNMVYD